MEIARKEITPGDSSKQPTYVGRTSQRWCLDFTFLCVLTLPPFPPSLCLQVQQDAERTACVWSAAPAGRPSASDCGLLWVLIKLTHHHPNDSTNSIAADNHVHRRDWEQSLSFIPVQKRLLGSWGLVISLKILDIMESLVLLRILCVSMKSVGHWINFFTN